MNYVHHLMYIMRWSVSPHHNTKITKQQKNTISKSTSEISCQNKASTWLCFYYLVPFSLHYMVAKLSSSWMLKSTSWFLHEQVHCLTGKRRRKTRILTCIYLLTHFNWHTLMIKTHLPYEWCKNTNRTCIIDWNWLFNNNRMKSHAVCC